MTAGFSFVAEPFDLLSRQQLADRWQMHPVTLQQWAAKGWGPRWLKLNTTVRYPMSEVLAFEEANMNGGAA